MKQIEKNTLCYYCMGCERQAMPNYKPVMRCKNFVAGVDNWQDKIRKELKNENKSRIIQ